MAKTNGANGKELQGQLCRLDKNNKTIVVAEIVNGRISKTRK